MEFKISKIESGQTLLKFLKKTLRNLPLSRIHSSLRKKDIKVNGERVSDGSRIIKEDDIVFIYGVGEVKIKRKEFKRFQKNFDIIHEDEHKLIVYKPGKLVIHAGENVNSLDNQVLTYLEETGQWTPGEASSFTPTHCHRIDKATCGLVIYAKDKKTASWFSENINNKELIQKYYLCTINGKTDKHFTIEGYISEDKKMQRMVVSDEETPGSKYVKTEFRTLGFDGVDSLVEAKLLTGRKHQIRASLHKIKKPIVGDEKYGSRIPIRLQLESYKLIISGRTFKTSKLFNINDIR